MLSPHHRAIAMDLLRPPSGFRIDQAVLTTYSLDLDVLLALPLAVLAHSDRGVEELLDDPMLVLEALREAGERVHVLVDEGGIAIPQTNRALYSLLEPCVHPVRAPGGGVFHPKLWVVRFIDESGNPLIRVAVASRNLTFDRSWDVALTSEGVPGGARKVRQSRALADLLRSAGQMAVHGLPAETIETLAGLADQVERIAFPAPEKFESPIAFEALGLSGAPHAAWQPANAGTNLLAIAPFVNRTGLDMLASVSGSQRTLISRREALDELSEDALAPWQQILVLSESALDEADDATARASDLHAKLIAIEQGRRVSWYVGSANLTAAAFTGRNVEVMAAITGPRGNANNGKGFGIERFRESGFLNLCEPYQRAERTAEDEEIKKARILLESARSALARSELSVQCRLDGKEWRWCLNGKLPLPDGVSVTCWPVSVVEGQSRTLELPIEWSLPISHLTAFVAFRLKVSAKVDDIRMVLKLPVEGMPEGRSAHVLRTLIDSPERFLRFLRALLGGLEGMADWMGGEDAGTWQGEWMTGLGGDTLLEDLVRAASRDPARLEPARRLIADLRSTPEGRKLVPDDLYQIWQVVDSAVSRGGQE